MPHEYASLEAVRAVHKTGYAALRRPDGCLSERRVVTWHISLSAAWRILDRKGLILDEGVYSLSLPRPQKKLRDLGPPDSPHPDRSTQDEPEPPLFRWARRRKARSSST